MLQTLKNAWNTKEIRNKILFTIMILLVYRIGTVIPVPFVRAENFQSMIQGTILQQMNWLSGNSLGNLTIFALGVSPYINASIIIQLLGVVFPKLGELAKNDKDKMNLITRIVTVALAIITAVGLYILLMQNKGLTNAATQSDNPKTFWLYGIVIVACYVAGASIIMWLGERINEKGIGNGISMILFANIVSSIPSIIINLVTMTVDTYSYTEKAWLYGIVSTVFSIALIAAIVGMFVFVIWVTGSERRIPIQYAKRVVGRKMYGGQSSNLPIKLNMTGVMPVIFASSIVVLPATVIELVKGFKGADADTTPFYEFLDKFGEVFSQEGFIYPVVLVALIIAFSYFYTQISFDPIEVANNIKKQGGTIPGIRQGRPTAMYIKKILGKVTIVGAIFLSIVAVVPVLAGPHILHHIIEWILGGGGTVDSSTVDALSASFAFGGTTLLIIVGVVLETFRELEAQLTMRNYKGFL